MTRQKLVLALGLLMVLGMTSCGTRHIAIPSGATGIVLKKGVVAFPDSSGKLTPGAYEGEPGDLIRRPKSTQELIDTLKAAGIKVDEPAQNK